MQGTTWGSLLVPSGPCCCCWYLLTASSREVSAPVVTSQCINLQHVDWNHTNCRFQNCSCNNSGDCLRKYVGHHYARVFGTRGHLRICRSPLRCLVLLSISHITTQSVQGAFCSWKVMEFRKTIFQAWKVTEIAKVMESHGKVIENDDNVMEFLQLHWAVL